MRYLKEVLASRELLANLTLREIRGQYKRTIFGQLWSLVNPLASMLVYTLVFAFILRVEPEAGDPSGLDIFAVWLLCGLLPWAFFSNVVDPRQRRTCPKGLFCPYRVALVHSRLSWLQLAV